MLKLRYAEESQDRHWIVEYCRASDQRILKEFNTLWRLPSYWPNHPPLLAFYANPAKGIPETFVGLHAHSVTKQGTRYINSLMQWVHPKMRGLGLGGHMVDYMIRHANAERLKMRTPFQGDGYDFWTGFGVEPIGKIHDREEYVFDLSLAGISNIEDFVARAKAGCAVPSTDNLTLRRYKRDGVIFIHPAWEHLNE
jgi:GNAT superfamily N-acetyltransferase